MMNGDSLNSSTWYQEMTIIPNPSDSNHFYLFHIGVTQSLFPGFYYSLVDLSYNSGLGKVIQKNIQLQSFPVCDGIAAVKHGNGRDWWVMFRRWDPSGTTNNEFYTYLITKYGMQGPFIQNIGHQHANSFNRLVFSTDGLKLYCCTNRNLLEVYDFDRCSGLLSNVWTINDQFGTVPQSGYWSLAVSPDKSKLYLTADDEFPPYNTSYLFQYNLNDPDPLLTADTLYTDTGQVSVGLVRLAPDGKVYFSSIDYTPDSEFFYLYDSAHYNNFNMNLGVVNQPDSLGSSCQFTPFSFYLGGHRTYAGLPNNPNYELDPDTNSICDTITVVNDLPQHLKEKLYVWFNSQWQTAFINAQHLIGKSYALQIYDVAGRNIFKEEGKLDSEFYSKNLNCASFSSGMYIISLTTENEMLNQKFIIEK